VIDTDSRAWWGLPALCTLVVLWLVHAELLFTPTIPASYDLTGHLLPIAELRYRLLPQGRLHGWSADWFAGFPLYYFYFPLPALIAAGLSFVTSLEAAIKVTSVLGLVAFPSAIYVLFRALIMTRAEAALATVVGATFMLMQSFWFLGGNIASTVAGEFAFSISFTLSLLYLATLLKATARPTSFIVPSVLLAAIALSHLVTTVTVVAVSAMLLRDPAKRRPIFQSWITAFLLSAFWSLPFLARRSEMAAVYTNAARSFGEAMPLQLWAVVPGAVIGALLVRNHRSALPLVYLTVAGIVLYFFAGGFVYPGRFLPYWYLGLHMLAGYTVARALHLGNRWKIAGVIVAVVVPVILLNAVRGSGYLRHWSGAGYRGLQARVSWPTLETLFSQLKQGDGRIYWEQAPQQLSALGSRNLAAVTPYLAPGQQVVNGLWHESSRTHEQLIAIDSAIARARLDPRYLDQALGTLRDLGVTRFVTLTAATAQLFATSGVPVMQTTPTYAIFRLPGKPLIESASGGNVEILEWSDERVRFRTTSPGAPHIVRMSYFPNWRARGGELQRGEHSMMMVTPRQQEVELRFERTTVEIAGIIISVVAALGLVGVSLRTLGRERS
jgi:hypothetical protein